MRDRGPPGADMSKRARAQNAPWKLARRGSHNGRSDLIHTIPCCALDPPHLTFVRKEQGCAALISGPIKHLLAATDFTECPGLQLLSKGSHSR